MAYRDRSYGSNRHQDRGRDDRWSGGRSDRDRSRHDDDHRSLLERIEAKLNRLFGDDDDRSRYQGGGYQGSRSSGDRGGRFESRPGWGDERGGYAMGESEGDDDRILGGPHIDAPGWDPSFPGPRFDRVDVGSTGTHGVHPVSSVYGAGYGIGAMGSAGGGDYARERMMQRGQRGGGGGSSDISDHSYSEWRRRQIEALDNDYDEYRREHQSKFDQEFHGWREKRQGQRSSMSRVTEHMEVVGSDGSHVGTVDAVKGDRIILTKSDEASGGRHHSIPCSWIESVDDKVTINRSAEDAHRAWRDEENNRALFEREDQGSEGPRVLDRSFRGTY
jgi:hypothetical protein